MFYISHSKSPQVFFPWILLWISYPIPTPFQITGTQKENLSSASCGRNLSCMGSPNPLLGLISHEADFTWPGSQCSSTSSCSSDPCGFFVHRYINLQLHTLTSSLHQSTTDLCLSSWEPFSAVFPSSVIIFKHCVRLFGRYLRHGETYSTGQKIWRKFQYNTIITFTHTHRKKKKKKA